MSKQDEADPAPEAAQQTPEQSSEQSPHRGSGYLGLCKAIACVAVIVLAEVVTASMVFPSGRETEALARQIVSAGATGMDGEGAGQNASSAGPDRTPDTREVELGSFSVTRYNPANNRSLSIDFVLYGTVLAGDVAQITPLLGQNEARIREQVIMTLQGAEVTDLTDAGLALIKRRLLEKTNRALGKPMLREVLFSNFNFVER